MSKYATLMANVPQSQPLNERQVKNAAGGFVFQINKWARLERFLVLGSDAPTYYNSARDLTRDNARVVLDCYAEDHVRTVQTILDVSEKGRAPKNDPAIFALALGAAHQEAHVRVTALDNLRKVCRTGTHLFQFVDTVRSLGRGWGRSLKRAIASWYDARTVDDVAFQVVKYRQREGYTHQRLLRTSHPTGGKEDLARGALYNWIAGKETELGILPHIVVAHRTAMDMEEADTKVLAQLVGEARLPWEALPTWANTKPEIWQAQLEHMGLTALVLNLGNMTRVGALKPLSKEEDVIVARLSDANEIRRSRLHPYAILQALAVYRSGKGVKGAGAWTPVRSIVDALDKAFYTAFANVEATGKRHLLALDVSGSMGDAMIGGVLSAREASAAMALVTMNAEPKTHGVGFTGGMGRFGFGRGPSPDALTQLSISPRQGLGNAVQTISRLPMGSTDCALPMLYALQHRILVDVFVVYTDSETWIGQVHPVEALRRYREATGLASKLVVVGCTSTGFSIADPNDPGMLDVVGFDASAPAVMADFIRG